MNAKAQQKERSHEEILDSAARLIRRGGIAGANVADVMRGAGLTVGGFYAHFASKDALVDETMRRAFRDLRAKLFQKLDGASALETVLRRYLSRTHRDDLEGGCPLPAIAGEIATGEASHRERLAEELAAIEREVEALLPRTSKLPPRQLALGLFALLVGGLTLARAVRGTPLSDDLLRSARAFARAALGSLEETSLNDQATATRRAKEGTGA